MLKEQSTSSSSQLLHSFHHKLNQLNQIGKKDIPCIKFTTITITSLAQIIILERKIQKKHVNLQGKGSYTPPD